MTRPGNPVWGDVGLGIALGLALAAAVAGPDLFRLSGEVLGYANMDKWGAVYLHDQLHRSLAAGRLPTHDPDELWPVGAPLAALNGSNSLEMLASAPFHLLAAFPLWFNLGHLVWLPLNLLAMLPLARRLWPDERGVRLGAAATWALSPVFLGEIAAGRLTQVALLGLPLAVRACLDASAPRTDGRGDGWRTLTIGAGGLALTGLGYWYYAIFLALLAPAWIARAGVLGGGEGVRRAGIALLSLGAIAALLVAPALLLVAASAHTAGIDPGAGLDPARLSPVFDNALQLGRSQPRQLLGWFPWVLAPGLAFAAWTALRAGERRIRADSATWLALGGLSLLFALGPGQRLGGRVWLLPYWPLWRFVPTLARLTHPSRWVDFGMIFLVVSAFSGVYRLRGVSRVGARAVAILAPVLLLVQLYAQGSLPLGSFVLAPTGVWAAVGAGAGAIITVPVMHAPEACRWQPFHHRPVLGGMVEGLPWAWPAAFRAKVEGNALLLQLLALGDGHDAPLDVRAGDVDGLRAEGFTQIVLDLEAWRAWPRGARIPIVERLGALGTPLLSGPDGAVWDLPADAAPGNAVPPAGVRLPQP